MVITFIITIIEEDGDRRRDGRRRGGRGATVNVKIYQFDLRHRGVGVARPDVGALTDVQGGSRRRPTRGRPSRRDTAGAAVGTTWAGHRRERVPADAHTTATLVYYPSRLVPGPSIYRAPT